MSADAPAPESDVAAPIGKEERQLAALCHFAGLPIFAIVAMANILAPLLIWLLKKEEMPFVDAHGKESLNFQITIWIAYVVAAPALCLPYVGGIAFAAIALVQLIFSILGTIAAYEGRPYRYPVSLRLIS